MIENDRVIHEVRYPHPVNAVWDAITDPAALAAWLMPNTFAPTVGHRFQLDASPGFGVIEGEVLEIDPPNLLRCRWTISGYPTEVTITLEADDAGTLLTLEHVRLDPNDRREFDNGWTAKLQQDLGLVLDGTHDRARAELTDGLYRHPAQVARSYREPEPSGEADSR